MLAIRIRIEFPVLVAIASEPIAAIVMPFIAEAHGDAILAKSPNLFDQAIVELARPFAGQKRFDLCTAMDEFGAVAPAAVGCVGEGHARGIAAVPRILGEPRLFSGGLGVKGGKRRSRHGLSFL